MAGIPGFWTKARIRRTKEILGKHISVAAAADAVGREFKVKCTANSVRHALKAAGEPTPFSLLKGPEIHPVEHREKLDQQAADKRKINDLVQELRDAKARQAFLDELKQMKPTPKIVQREYKSGLREMTGVVLASDWHVEETVESESVAYRNEYNLEIAGQRIDRFFHGIVWNFEHHRASGKIALRDLVFWLGGDLISGFIHEDLVESNQLSPTETVVWLMPRIRDGLKLLADKLDLNSLVIPCSYGNHGRTGQKSRIQNGYSNSYEWLMYKMLADGMKGDPRIRFEVTNSAHQYVEVYDHNLHFTHGDSLKYAGGVGGLAIPLLKAISAWNSIKYSTVHHIGHFHQLRDFGCAQANGSLIGYGPYSQHIRAEYEVPQQAFYLFDSRRGKCVTTSLWVADNDDASSAPKGARKK